MLILTRKVGESITIGDDVVVTVLSVSRNQARLGISAPRSTSVNRGEVQVRVDLERLPSENDPTGGVGD